MTAQATKKRKPTGKPTGRPAGRQAQNARLTQMVIFDALRSWVIPTVAGVGIFVIYVLYNIELIDPRLAVGVTGVLALLVLLFYGLRGFFDEQPEGRRAALLAGFALLWCAVTIYPFYRAVNPGTPLFSTELQRGGAPVTVPLRDHPGRYSLYVEGHFLPTQGRENLTATYHIALGHDGETNRILEGTFRHEWGSQRVGAGRRSSLVPVMHESNIVLDELDDPDGHDLTLQLKDLSEGVRDAVTVHVYSPGVPKGVLIALALLTIAAAMGVDTWREKGSSDGLMATLTIAALVGVTVFRNATSAVPGFPQVIVGGVAGTIGGAIGGWLLSQVARPLRQYMQ
jgi:hypothetical protein